MFICKLAQIMYNLKTIFCRAFLTNLRLMNFCILKRNFNKFITFNTSKFCCFHLWKNIRSSNDNTSKWDEPINKLWTNLSHNFDLSKFSNWYHHFISFYLFSKVLFSIWEIHIFSLKHYFNGLIKAIYHFCREIYELKI